MRLEQLGVEKDANGNGRGDTRVEGDAEKIRRDRQIKMEWTE